MIKIEDFKEGGSKRKFITHTDVLSEIDGEVLSDEQKQKLIEKCYTMCDGYIAQPGETTGDDTRKTGEDETQEQASDSVDEEVSTENDIENE